jgi:hypothetical protein
MRANKLSSTIDSPLQTAQVRQVRLPTPQNDNVGSRPSEPPRPAEVAPVRQSLATEVGPTGRMLPFSLLGAVDRLTVHLWTEYRRCDLAPDPQPRPGADYGPRSGYGDFLGKVF